MPNWIPLSEKSQIEKRLPYFVKSLLESNAPLNDILFHLQKPLRPVWVSPQTKKWKVVDASQLTFYPIVCLSASRVNTKGKNDDEGRTKEEDNTEAEVENECEGSLSRSSSQRSRDYIYVQGAADDQESWSLGLTPEMFWKNVKRILCASKDEIEGVVRDVVNASRQQKIDEVQWGYEIREEFPQKSSALKDTFFFIANSGIAIGSSIEGTTNSVWETFDAVLNCSPWNYAILTPKETTNENDTEKEREGRLRQYIHLPTLEGKKDKNKLSKILPDTLEFIEKHLNCSHRILIHCYQDISTAFCVCLAVFAKYFDLNGERLRSNRTTIDKKLLRSLSLFISKFCPEARPSRAMMNDIHRYFMTPSHLQSRVMQRFFEFKRQQKSQQTETSCQETTKTVDVFSDRQQSIQFVTTSNLPTVQK